MWKIILLGFSIRLAISAWNGFFGPSFGAEYDAETFHLEAISYSRNFDTDSLQIGTAYSYFLAVFYRLLAESLFLGSVLSTLAWTASAFYLLKIAKLFSIDQKKIIRLLFLYALLPTSILYTSVTLRESYQLLFVTIAFYSAIKIIANASIIYWFSLGASLIASSSLHGALLAFSVIFFGLTIFMRVAWNRNQISWKRIFLLSPFIFFLLVAGLTVFLQFSYQIENGLASSIESYQAGGLGTDARAHYKSDVAISGWQDLILFIPTSLFQYLFEPMPWKVSSLVDAPLVIENFLRAWLIFLAIKNLKKNFHSSSYHIHFFLLLSYTLIELIWSVGTINWGTASRHHIPSIGLLLISAFLPISNRSNGIANKRSTSTRLN